MPRLFVAIDLPQEISGLLHGICCGLPGARWLAQDQMHLTLRFIGEVDGGLFRDIREELEHITAPRFSLRVRGLGVFPPRKAARVLWAGVEPLEQVLALRNRVEAALVRLGLAPEGRKFAPHITLARLQETPVARLHRFLAGNSLFATGEFLLEEFHLYSSVLSAKGASHAIEASYPLRSQDR